ncbi:MAG: hypothetical protein ACI92E_003274, partial [Oceanicoccus sp.]
GANWSASFFSIVVCTDINIPAEMANCEKDE